MDLDIHEATKGFPLSVNYYDVRDMAEQRRSVDPITIIDNNKILDGRTRFRVCCELGIEPSVEEVAPDSNPYEVIWNKNMNRPFFEGVERYLAWWWCFEKAERWYHEHATGMKYRYRPGTPAPKNNQRRVSIRDCQLLARVRASSVHIGDRLLRKDPELAEQVRMGRMSPAEAIRQLKK